MECRGLIEEVITTRPEYGGRSKRHRDFRDKNQDLAAQPDDALTACLFSAFEEVTEEIKVLFDPKNEYSLVIPRYPTLKKVIEKINIELDYDTYREDEFLGWVYQYFNSREKDRVFEEVRTRKKKISGSDIINVTQLYTEKYMVRFLVENSLGAMWMEMYPDSQLCNKWEYFVKDPNNSRREPKPVKEITFLDPAGGSGHFQLYAFDLFYDMYLEEGIILKDQIPDFILRYNLHGIDIDLRAIQLSALGLYMKAKSKNPDMKVQHMNLVSADAIMLDSDILEEFLQEFKEDQTAQELIKTIWKGLENVRELGSLLKVEEQIDDVIKRQKDKRLDFFSEGKEKSWEQWKRDLLAALKRYYEKAAQTFDINKQMFASEACKGVQLLDLLEQRSDVVATNPPYMSNRNMGLCIKENLRIFYPKTNSDLYATFIERCMQLSNKNGYISMITQHSFMFLEMFHDLRKLILNDLVIRNLSHLGPHAFEDIIGEKVNTVMFTFQKKTDIKFSVFIRLVDTVNKDIDLINCIKNDLDIYRISQNNFKLIDGYPFAYFIGNRLINIFKNQKFENFIDIPGSQNITANNDKYLRFSWEIPSISNGRWVPYAKGGEHCKYYGNLDLTIDWSENARLFYKENKTSNLLNKIYWYKEGATYTEISSKSFSIRYLPSGCIFDKKGPSMFLKNPDINLFYLIGFCNTRLFSFIMSILNPTISYQINDVKRVPFIVPPKYMGLKISRYTNTCVNIKKSLLQFAINDREFKQPAIIWGYHKTKGDN
jgi:hypothetical protein